MKHAILFLALLSTIVHAQPWSGVIAPARAIDWSATSPGVVGGVPSATWTQCGSTIAAGASAATIQSALNGCAANHYVLLGAGTFNLSTGLNMVPNVVLRGSGSSSTLLVFSAAGSCGGLGASICFKDSNGYGVDSSPTQPGGSNAATFCGTASSGACNNTYSQGATTIQLSSIGAAGVVNGQYIYLDQINDNPATPSTTFSTGMLICDNVSATDGCSLEGGAPGRVTGGVERNLIQFVKVVSGCASACTGAGPFSVTITPGLYGLKWDTSHSPGAWWSANNMQNSGIENLTIDSTGTGVGNNNVGTWFLNAFNCWETGVRGIKPNRNHVWLYQSAHITVANNYFYLSDNSASVSYGVESFMAGDNLVENNIFQQVTGGLVNGPSTGSVFAYNFMIDYPYTVSDWMIADSLRHDAGAQYNLFEGNISEGFAEDAFHGTGGANTTFRNYVVGWAPGKAVNTAAFQLYSYNRFENVIGNVLGCNNATSTFPGNCGSPYPTAYQTSVGDGPDHTIYDLGAGDTEADTTVLADPYTVTSMMRWGNYDTYNAAVRWVSGEVPSGLSDGYANSVPASHTLPASFWLTSKPSWWGSVSWPAIGPDVATGTIPGVASHAALIPAANCYFVTMSGPQDGTGSVLAFDANTCYTSTPPTPTPAAPQNLLLSPL
jgi:hypothetical protein